MRQAGRAAGVAERIRRGASIMLKDFGLLASVYTARFLVWRRLRERRRAHAARRKLFKPVDSDGGPGRARQ